ncbi:MAG: hypothetical protein IPL84_03890 [Chitinophagaceae bacterium]|nr:hypothetical protein [Chitinophagaceae bacterium]
MDFKIDGKPVQISSGYNVEKIKKHLESLKDGEFLSMEGLASKLIGDPRYLREIIKSKLPENMVLIKNRAYCGSVKTIKAYKAL